MEPWQLALSITGIVVGVAASITAVFVLAFWLSDVVEDATGKSWLGFMTYFVTLWLVPGLLISAALYLFA